MARRLPRPRRRGAARLLSPQAASSFARSLFEQYLFELQWTALKRYANERGVHLFGDLPFYVDRNSVDVWWERELFALDASGEPLAVAGVPPDYFNADGQLWGNPLYDWDAMERQRFPLVARAHRQRSSRGSTCVRIDHFRALESYWAVPAGAPTARARRMAAAAAATRLLTALRAQLGAMPLVAEDLGIITDEVRALRDRFELPGMVVLQFAFDGSPDNPHLPRHHRRNAVVYTGTHDNDTTVGWYASLDAARARRRPRHARRGPTPPVPEFLIDAAYASNAALAIVPMQDFLARDSGARMNTPGTVVGNWRWRFAWSDVPASLAATSPRARCALRPQAGRPLEQRAVELLVARYLPRPREVGRHRVADQVRPRGAVVEPRERRAHAPEHALPVGVAEHAAVAEPVAASKCWIVSARPPVARTTGSCRSAAHTSA